MPKKINRNRKEFSFPFFYTYCEQVSQYHREYSSMNLNPLPQNGHVGESPDGAAVDPFVGAEGIKLGGEGGAEVTVGCVPDGGLESAAGGDPPDADGGPFGNFPFFLLASNLPVPPDRASLAGRDM